MSRKLFEPGSVALVGAGPGDPDLLTLRAVRYLTEADVVLYDKLVSAEILGHVPRGVARICVGKRAGKASWAQADINALLVAQARKGRRVLRLKAGDPSVFGRSGEEIAALTAARVPVCVVPGITTASALAASVSVSLTHRASARSLRFVTAHSASGALPDDLDWQGLADPATTLIVYMGARTGPDFAQALMAAGRSAETPAVVAENVSRADEVFRGTILGRLAESPIARRTDGPLTIAIGEVFRDALGAQAEHGLRAQAVGNEPNML